LRQADDGDSIEAKAIDLAQRLIERADLLIAMTDHEHPWPALPRDPDIHVINKIDLYREPCAMRDAPCAGSAAAGDHPIPSPAVRGRVREEVSSSGTSPARRTPPIPISALHGTGLRALVTAVRQFLVLDTDLSHPGPWLFDDRLTGEPS
jgi:tRNA U34 5-carboxymethylaminomethyl modifying GTPase MnmE/TrmE